MAEKNAKPSDKTAKRSLNAPVEEPTRGAPTTDQDPQRRLGNFEGAGEPPLKGSRTSGIGGQSKQKNKTDKLSS